MSFGDTFGSIDMTYRPGPPSHMVYPHNGPIGIAPYDNWSGGYGDGRHVYGPIVPPPQPIRVPDMTEEERMALLDAIAQMARTNIVITADGTSAPVQPQVTAPAEPEDPEGVSTEDSFRPGRKLDID